MRLIVVVVAVFTNALVVCVVVINIIITVGTISSKPGIMNKIIRSVCNICNVVDYT